jgi:hypothetical protein
MSTTLGSRSERFSGVVGYEPNATTLILAIGLAAQRLSVIRCPMLSCVKNPG